MQLAVFGATGPTGQQLVKQALEQGHSVAALARTPEKLAIQHSSLRIVKGNVLDIGSVEETVAGSSAVLSCLGRRNPFSGKGDVWRGTHNIIVAMKKLGVRRLIIESAYAAGSSREFASLGMKLVTSTVLGWAYHEKEVLEPEVMSSGLDWVIVRPPALRDGTKTGACRAGERLRLSVRNWINRADVADFMLKQVASDEWLRKTPTISM
ncbi:MAG TPA: SDR family oxidoreductase [Terriglobales bacterium]|nr:SDR family oxidoreductase [Terriglobales bacterium]